MVERSNASSENSSINRKVQVLRDNEVSPLDREPPQRAIMKLELCLLSQEFRLA